MSELIVGLVCLVVGWVGANVTLLVRARRSRELNWPRYRVEYLGAQKIGELWYSHTVAIHRQERDLAAPEGFHEVVLGRRYSNEPSDARAWIKSTLALDRKAHALTASSGAYASLTKET